MCAGTGSCLGVVCRTVSLCVVVPPREDKGGRARASVTVAGRIDIHAAAAASMDSEGVMASVGDFMATAQRRSAMVGGQLPQAVGT